MAVAESCTGGFIAHRLTNVPGSSAYFLGGVIAYSDALKRTLLGVSPRLLQRHGAVSRAVIAAMARGIRRRTNATVGLAVTGIAGPTGGAPRKPVGTIWIAVATPRRTRAWHQRFRGGRLAIKRQAAHAALRHLLHAIVHRA